MATVRPQDYSIATNGDIRYTGAGNDFNNTVIEFHRWLGDLMDDALATGNDLLDITDATASERSTDNIITLKAPFNIDDTVAQHLFDGSIIQKNGDEIYEGLLVFAAANTPLQILQNGKPAYPNFWGTGINADSTNGISHRFMLKVRTGAVDIDGRRLVGQTRAVGKTYSEFKINGTARGNNVLALTYATDLNNSTAEATIRGWTTITNTTEGYQLLDVDNNTLSENYYSQWTRAALTINQFYERHKWLHRESTIEASITSGGTAANHILANNSITEQAQSFTNGGNAQYLTRVRVNMRKVEVAAGTVTGNLTVKLYAHSGSFGSTSVGGGTLHATSVNFDVATLTTAYKEYEIAFTTQFEMAASTNYVIAFQHAVINATNYVEIQGSNTTSAGDGNRSSFTGTWAAVATDDLYFKVYASPKQYGIPGEVFRGITHEVVMDTPSTLATTVASGNGATATITFAAQPVALTVGQIVIVNGVTPTGYNGTYTITASTTTTVSYANTTTGAQTVAGTVSPHFIGVEAVSWSGGTGQMVARTFLDTGAAALTINVVAASGTFTRTTGSFLTDGFRPGMTIVASGLVAGNIAPKIISTVTATVITVTDISGLANETGNNDERIRAGHMWIQLLTGVAPTNDQVITGGTSGATAQMNVTITERTLSQPAVGASTGSAIIGSYGLGMATGSNLTSSDKLFDLTNTQRVPPNNVSFTVSGLAVGEDRVLVAPLGYEFAFDNDTGTDFAVGDTVTWTLPGSGGSGYLSFVRYDAGGTTGRMQIRLLTGTLPADDSAIEVSTTKDAIVNGAVVASEDPRQLKLNTTLSGASETQVVCTASIPTDTPTTGTIRIQLTSGIFRQVAYSSYTGATFTLASATVTNIQINVVATAGTFTRLSGSFLTDGFLPGMGISMTGFTGGNNTTKIIASVTALVITVTNTSGLADETGGGDEDIASTAWDFSSDSAAGHATDEAIAKSIFISYIDSLATAATASFTSVYLADRSLFVRVRDGASTPIKTFETTGTLASANTSATAIRTSDA